MTALARIQSPRVAGYVRVSRVGGRKGDGYISPDDQRLGILERAQNLDVEIHDDDWFFDEDYTGGDFKRPMWQELMVGLETGEFAGVICVRVDRFARNVAEGATMIERIAKAGAFFATSDLAMDTKTSEGKYVLNNFLNNAEFQLNVLKAGWWRAKQRAIARGAHIGATPLGMGRVPRNAEAKAGCLFCLDEWRTPLTKVFDYAASVPADVSVSVIARWANEHASRPDGRRWKPQTIGYLLKSRVYLGEVSYRPDPDSEVQFEPLINRHAHEALVDPKTWLAAQRAPRPRQDSRSSRADRVNLLQGLVRCQACRHTMPASWSGSRSHKTHVYRCEAQSSAGRCQHRSSIVSARLEQWVIEQVRSQLTMDESFTPVVDDRRNLVAQAERAVADAGSRLLSIEQNVELGASHPESWSRLVAEARSQLDGSTEALSDLMAEAKRIAVAPATLNWETVTARELRDDILPGAIDCIMVRQGRNVPVHERAIILWRGQGPSDLPRRGRPASGIVPWDWPTVAAAA